MFSLQQVIKATATANGSVGGSATDLYKLLRAATRGVTSSAEATTTTTTANTAITQTHTQSQPQPKQSSQASSEFNFSDGVSHNSPAIAHGCCRSESESKSESAHDVKPTTVKQFVRNLLLQHSQDLQEQQQRFIHSKCSSQDSAKSSQKQQQTTKFAMSSLAAEPLQAEISSADGVNTVAAGTEGSDATSGTACHEAASSAGKKPCFNTGLADILQFMELIGNLKVSTDTDWSRNPFLPQSLSPSFSSHRFFPRPYTETTPAGANRSYCDFLSLHNIFSTIRRDSTVLSPTPAHRVTSRLVFFCFFYVLFWVMAKRDFQCLSQGLYF